MKLLNLYVDIKKYNCSTSMALDEIIYNKLGNKNEFTFIRYYKLKNKALTIGRFQDISTVNLEYCKNNNIEISRRLTGGRGVFHNNDIIISAIFNKKLYKYNTKKEMFEFLPCIIKKVLTKMKFDFKLESDDEKYNKNFKTIGDCFSLPVKGELSYNRKKFFGAASYIENGNVLQQTSIQLCFNKEYEKVFYTKNNNYYDNLIDENKFFSVFKKALYAMFTVNEICFDKQEIIRAKKLADGRYRIKL